MAHSSVHSLLSHPADLSSDAALQSRLEDILAVFECVTGTIHLLNKESKMLELAAQKGIPEFLLDKVGVIPIGKGIAGAAAEKRDAVQMCNLQTDTSGVAKPDAKKTKVAGSLAVPILRDGELMGTLGIGKIEPYDFNEEEVSSLNQLADWLGLAL